MTTLRHTRHPVKPGRSSGRALVEPRPPRPAPTTDHPWEAGVRADLLRLDYTPEAIGAAVCWIDSRGTINGCPCVAREDWAGTDALVPVAPEHEHAQPDGDVESDPADWPGWCDDDRWAPTDPEPEPEPPAPARSFHPSAAESEWWAREAVELSAARVGRLVPGSATRRRRAQPDVTDADVIRGTGCCG